MSDQGESRLPEWGPGKTAKGRARLPSSRRRERPQLSCNLCRRRKMRCDRKHPCSTCVSRGLGSTCTFALNLSTSNEDGMGRPLTSVQDRIQQLEGLVVDLMRQASAGSAVQEPHTDPSSPSLVQSADCSPALPPTTNAAGDVSPNSDYGSMHMTDSSASYVNSSHWMAILDGIAEIKGYFEEDDEIQVDDMQPNEPAVPEWTGPELLYGCQKPATKEEILASLPKRSVVDRLVSHYFNTFELSPAVLHSGQFLHEYERFWENPSDTPVLWLGLLFTIMRLSAHFQMFKLDLSAKAPATLSMEQELQSMRESFRQKVVQCLVLGNYLKGGPYVLETLMLYLAGEIFSRRDAEIGIWMLLGTIVQLAFHMGYHKDPSHFKNMPPFISEMRRRVWATVQEMDLGISAQVGLPRLIKPSQIDTKEPSNLQDSDFNEKTTEMPPSRPETELTPILYRIVRARIYNVTGLIWDFAGDTRGGGYNEVMDIDAKLQKSHDTVPECLKWRSIGHCITDPSQLIIQKVYLDIMFHRTRIVLHRKYLHRAGVDTKYAFSEKVCVESALKLLEYQHMLQEETQPFCRLYEDRWRISCLLNHDFLLASSILCSYLQRIRKEPGEKGEPQILDRIMEALKRAHDIWAYSSNSSKEARKAAKALSVVLGISTGLSPNTRTNEIPEFPSPYNFINSMEDPQDKTTGFSVRLPVFDMTISNSWSIVSDDTLGSSSGATPATNFEWQTMEASDAWSNIEWPWTL